MSTGMSESQIRFGNPSVLVAIHNDAKCIYLFSLLFEDGIDKGLLLESCTAIYFIPNPPRLAIPKVAALETD